MTFYGIYSNEGCTPETLLFVAPLDAAVRLLGSQHPDGVARRLDYEQRNGAVVSGYYFNGRYNPLANGLTVVWFKKAAVSGEAITQLVCEGTVEVEPGVNLDLTEGGR